MINTIPLNDSKDHEHSQYCGCNPKVELDGLLIVHNSFDWRESAEQLLDSGLGQHKMWANFES